MTRLSILLLIYGVTLVSYLGSIALGRALGRRGVIDPERMARIRSRLSNPLAVRLHLWLRKPKDACQRRGNVAGLSSLIFANNLILAAFLDNTLCGVIFFVPLLAKIWAGLALGAFQVRAAEALRRSPRILRAVMVLEFGGYLVATTGGISLGLSLLASLFRRTVAPFWTALGELPYIYAVVVAFLLPAAWLEGRFSVELMRRLMPGALAADRVHPDHGG